MNQIAYEIVIGYGSETGTAQALAQELALHPAFARFYPRLMPLEEVAPEDLEGDAPLIIISASFGDGGPPGNAEAFLAMLEQSGPLPRLRYAVFGLGDSGYATFCGFGRRLDALLQERGATPIVNRVDVDGDPREFFDLWVPVLEQVLLGDLEAGKALHLQGAAPGANRPFDAPIIERTRLNSGEGPAAWNIRLSVAGSGMRWQAGDSLNVLPENEPELLQAIADWYGDPQAMTLLQQKELRLLRESVVRDLARLTGSSALKELLSFKQRKALADYLYHADILDLLQDHASPETVPLAELVRILSPVQTRAYSIVSVGDPAQIDLCVRELRYDYQGRLHRGTATRCLLQADAPVRVYVNASPGCQLVANPDVPLLFIGTGTGIAPLLGLLREIRLLGQKRETTLIFGEKHRAHDFLYREELEALKNEGVLGALHTAFSRDGDAKYYVQHVIDEQAAAIRDMLARGGHIYLCGNKSHLEKAVSTAIDRIMSADGGTVTSYWRQMAREGRLHLELY